MAKLSSITTLLVRARVGLPWHLVLYLADARPGPETAIQLTYNCGTLSSIDSFEQPQKIGAVSAFDSAMTCGIQTAGNCLQAANHTTHPHPDDSATCRASGTIVPHALMPGEPMFRMHTQLQLEGVTRAAALQGVRLAGNTTMTARGDKETTQQTPSHSQRHTGHDRCACGSCTLCGTCSPVALPEVHGSCIHHLCRVLCRCTSRVGTPIINICLLQLPWMWMPAELICRQ